MKENPKNIAVIGSGIAGLGAAWLLAKEHNVTLFEKDDYLGGHANTRTATFGDVSLEADTGFMVFNNETYPNLIALFDILGVESIKTDMSLGISLKGGEFEFTSDQFFSQRANFFKPSFWRLLRNIVHYNQHAAAAVGSFEDNISLRELLLKLELPESFAEKFLLPMSGAIWSSPKDDMLDYPAKQFVQFCENHGLMSPKTMNPFRLEEGVIQWYTPKGGSKNYVAKLVADMDATVHTGSGVVRIRRNEEGATVTLENGEEHTFDVVVCAAHPKQTLSMIETPSETETKLLSTFTYVPNRTVMHKDTSRMMESPKRWPSWTYRETKSGSVELSYNMNRLQSIDEQYPVFVTLNPADEIPAEDIFYEAAYEHPHFNLDTHRAQERIGEIQGTDKLYFVGAWLGHGFHEDGLRSAVEVAKLIGVKVPW